MWFLVNVAFLWCYTLWCVWIVLNGSPTHKLYQAVAAQTTWYYGYSLSGRLGWPLMVRLVVKQWFRCVTEQNLNPPAPEVCACLGKNSSCFGWKCLLNQCNIGFGWWWLKEKSHIPYPLNTASVSSMCLNIYLCLFTHREMDRLGIITPSHQDILIASVQQEMLSQMQHMQHTMVPVWTAEWIQTCFEKNFIYLIHAL